MGQVLQAWMQKNVQKFKNKHLLLASKLPKANLVLQEKLRDTGSG